MMVSSNCSVGLRARLSPPLSSTRKPYIPYTRRVSSRATNSGMAGIAGSLLSTRFYQQDGPAAGSSGALFGLFGVLIVVSYKYRHELPDTFRRAFRKGVLTVVAINLLFGLVSNFSKSLRFNLPLHFVDNWAHVAGLLTGAILAMILPYLAPEKKQHSGLEKTLLIISLLLVSYCFWRAYQLRPFIFQR